MPLKRCEELMQIVKSYYGGRDVTPEDLEMALLVGMSPHERRRLEKKKGFSCRAQAQNIIKRSSSNIIVENNGHDSENDYSLSEQFANDVAERNSQLDVDESNSQQDSENNNQLKYPTPSQGSTSLPVNTDDPIYDSNMETLETETVQQASTGGTSANGHVDRDPCSSDNFNQAIPQNADKKISLLGHGHHGKQVVELLLTNGGEEAIHQFCQRWRQVFVEAVHPRYLPSGWNIKHSGRRDFGDFSVYKPSKHAPQSFTD